MVKPIQEYQVALNPQLSFVTLTYRYQLKAGYVPSDTWDRADFGPSGIRSSSDKAYIFPS